MGVIFCEWWSKRCLSMVYPNYVKSYENVSKRIVKNYKATGSSDPNMVSTELLYEPICPSLMRNILIESLWQIITFTLSRYFMIGKFQSIFQFVPFFFLLIFTLSFCFSLFPSHYFCFIFFSRTIASLL